VPEGTRIAVAGVVSPSGTAETNQKLFDSLSAELKGDISRLVGTPVAREKLDAIAMRIEAEKPDMIAAVRRSLQPNGEAVVTFVVGHVSDDPELLANINSRYTIESVAVTGIIKEENLPQKLRDELRALVGKRLDQDESERLRGLLAAQYSSPGGFDVKRRIERGTQPGQVRLVFDVRLSLPERLGLVYQPKLVYHAFQGWSALVNFPITVNQSRFTFGLAMANEDDLIEQYSGFNVRFGRNGIGNPRLGMSVEFARYTQNWREATLSAITANPTIPEAYETRYMLNPEVSVRLWPNVGLSGGLMVTWLDSLRPGTTSQVNAFTFKVSSPRRWTLETGTNTLTASYELHVAGDGTGSDVDYTRQLVTGHYRYRQGRSTLLGDVRFGRATGDVPLFERFVVGDTNTLRGWNKFDLNPAGGTRMSYQSVEYRYWFVGVFLDVGSVWDEGGHADTKYSTGFGLQDDHAFITVAFPLEETNHQVTFMTGLRF
jgi:outer membrane protein assembly factor BamA